MPEALAVVEEYRREMHRAGRETCLRPEDADAHAFLDAVEEAMLNGTFEPDLVPIELPLTHRFTPGCYSREIFMPAGARLTSKIHASEHHYVVLEGRAKVYIPGGGTEVVEAGQVGITQPGTRRLLYIEEDCRWVTFHPLSPEEEAFRASGATPEEMVAMIEGRIIERRELPDGSFAHDRYLEALAERRLLEEAEQ